jgi:hypothetical protein
MKKEEKRIKDLKSTNKRWCLPIMGEVLGDGKQPIWCLCSLPGLNRAFPTPAPSHNTLQLTSETCQGPFPIVSAMTVLSPPGPPGTRSRKNNRTGGRQEVEGGASPEYLHTLRKWQHPSFADGCPMCAHLGGHFKLLEF